MGEIRQGDMQITSALADFATSATFDRLPGPIVGKIKQILLDCIGCALGSYAIDRSKIAVELVEDLGGRPQATVIGHRRTSCALAAFANGELINSLDYDPNGPLVPHSSPFVIPPSLALGERRGVSGKELITALAVGLEAGGRVASSMSQHKIPTDEPPFYKEAERQSYAMTIFGGVAGACSLLRLDPGQTANALGIAGASAPVPAGMKALHTPPPVSMVKYNCWAGWVAQLATVATLAAEKGFTGDTTILDGEWGFWKIIGSPFFRKEKLIEGLGQEWHIEEVDFKVFPCCGQNQAAVEGIHKIISEQKIRPEEIDEILIKGDPMLLQQHRMQAEVRSFEDAQFCNAYTAAVAAFHGDRPSPVWQTRLLSQDPKIMNLMKKVRVEVHPKAGADITSGIKGGKTTSFHGATVEITAGGRHYLAEVTSRKGTFGNPLSDSELVKKFRENANFSMIKSRKVDDAVEMICGLEKVRDIRQIMGQLSIENQSASKC